MAHMFMPGHAHMTRLESCQHFAVFLLAVQFQYSYSL